MDHVATFKLAAAGVIWLQAVVGGLAPLVLKNRVSPVATSVLNMFAGGIFLAGSCLHLLPDAQNNKTLAAAGCFADGKCFQLAYFFYAVGFLVVMLLEVFAHSVQRQFGDRDSADRIDERTPLVLNTHKDWFTQVQPEDVATKKARRRVESNDNGTKADVDHSHPYNKQVHHEDHPKNGHSNGVTIGHTNSHGHGLLATSEGVHYGLSGMRVPVNGLAADGDVCVDMEVTHAHIHGIMDANPALAFIVFAALSFHSVMEGMGVGASNGAAWDILIAILAHKSLAAFALALELIHHKVPRERLVTTIGLFSVMTPLGIFLGWSFVDATQETAASGICSAMAGGTFLFVAVMETIPQELQNQKYLMAKCGALLAGFSAMGVLSIWT